MEAEKTLRQLTNKINGGVKASRNNSKYYNKQNQKEMSMENIQSSRKLSFLRKHLSLETAYTILGISENPKNLLMIGASGDISNGDCSNRTILSEPTLNYLIIGTCNRFIFF